MTEQTTEGLNAEIERLRELVKVNFGLYHEAMESLHKARSQLDLARVQNLALSTGKRDKCPDCGSLVILWRSANQSDPGDVDPRATCTNPDCEWGY